jgi:hypothetical protein
MVETNTEHSDDARRVREATVDFPAAAAGPGSSLAAGKPDPARLCGVFCLEPAAACG